MRLINAMVIAAALALGLGAAEARAQAVQLEFLNGLTPPEIPPYQSAIDEFNTAHPDIHITQTNSPWTEFWQQLQVRTASGTMPDVWRFVPGYGAQWLYGHQLLDLTPYVKNDPDINLSDANQTMLKYMTLDGKLYGIGYDFNGTAIFYSPELFDKAGVPYPKDGWTTQQMADAAETISKKLSTDGHKVWGLTGLTPDWTFEGWYHAFGTTMISSDNKFGANNAAGAATLAYFQDMIKAGAMPIPNQSDPSGAATALFISGNAAMLLGSGHTVTTFNDAGLDYGVARLPVGPAAQAGAGLGGSYVIQASTKYPDQAYQFLKYIISSPVMTKVITTGIPARDSAMARLDGHWKEFADNIKGGVPFPAVNGSLQVIDLQTQIFANVWNGTTEPAAALEEVAKQADPILASKAVD
jgi:multiple sugar transport system substrate-binding protein